MASNLPPKNDHSVEYVEAGLEKDLYRNEDARIRNPLADLTTQELSNRVVAFCSKYGFNGDIETFQKAALVAQVPEGFETIDMLSQDDKYHLRRETTRTIGSPCLPEYVLTCDRSLASAIYDVLVYRHRFDRLSYSVSAWSKDKHG
jgi:hypothetical protein